MGGISDAIKHFILEAKALGLDADDYMLIVGAKKNNAKKIATALASGIYEDDKPGAERAKGAFLRGGAVTLDGAMIIVIGGGKESK